MQSPAILDAIANWQILTLGVVLLLLELTVLNFFVVIWFGLAALVVGLVGFFYPFSHGEYQLLWIAVLGMVLLFLFRKRFLRTEQPNMRLETFEAGEIGIVEWRSEHWMMEYQGTWWRIANPNDSLVDGQRLRVKQVKNNQVWIEEGNTES